MKKRKDFSFGIIPLRHPHQWEVLLIKHHHGHWSFPKGHRNSDETPEQAAIRELQEETGVTIKTLLQAPPLKEDYFFREKGDLVEKTVTYFLAEVQGVVSIQKEENADFCWVSLERAEQIITFPEGKRLCQATQLLLNQIHASDS